MHYQNKDGETSRANLGSEQTESMQALILAIVMNSVLQALPNTDMDFWVGDWEVYVGKDKVGDDKVEKVLKGSAIIENWRDAQGNEGKSWFYFMPAKKSWKQVWVTEQGVYKEKESHPVQGGLQFVGTTFRLNGSTYPDRTTLTLNSDGTVHQVIEISRDQGKTWEVGFDAIYKRKPGQETKG